VSEQLDLAGRLSGDLDALDDFASEFGGRADAAHPERRVNMDQATVEKDLAKLVLSLVELIRQLMERQALRRVNAGSLSEEEVENMGETFLKLNRKMAELRMAFGLEREDLNLSLGPLGSLLEERLPGGHATRGKKIGEELMA
jgi:hypothetical protein